MAESLLVGRNFVSGICKLKSKNLKNLIFCFKNLCLYQPWYKRGSATEQPDIHAACHSVLSAVLLPTCWEFTGKLTAFNTAVIPGRSGRGRQALAKRLHSISPLHAPSSRSHLIQCTVFCTLERCARMTFHPHHTAPIPIHAWHQSHWTKAHERRKHCALAVVRPSQKISPRRRPPSRGRGTAKSLISRRWSLPSPTDPVWWRSMHPISSYRGNRP